MPRLSHFVFWSLGLVVLAAAGLFLATRESAPRTEAATPVDGEQGDAPEDAPSATRELERPLDEPPAGSAALGRASETPTDGRVELAAEPDALEPAPASGDLWKLLVRAKTWKQEDLPVPDGSMTLEVTGPVRREKLKGRVRDGVWTATAPFPREEFKGLQLFSARLGTQRYILHQWRDFSNPKLRFDGTEEIQLRPAQATFLHVIDPRTGELARRARLTFRSNEEAGTPGAFSFEHEFDGKPLRLDEFRARDLEDRTWIRVQASIPGVGQDSTRLNLVAGVTHVLRPSTSGSARFVWHTVPDLLPDWPGLELRPDWEVDPYKLRESESRARSIQVGNWSERRIDHRGAVRVSGPLTQLVEQLPVGTYVVDFEAKPEVGGVQQMKIGTARFTVEEGKQTEIEFRPAPVEADPWRILRVKVELPPGYEGKPLMGEVRLLVANARTEAATLPASRELPEFVPVMVLAGRHEVTLREPLAFAATFDVQAVPEHIERIVVPAPTEHLVRFRHADSGAGVETEGLRWRSRTGTSLDRLVSEVPPSIHGADGPMRILAATEIEVMPGSRSAYTTVDFEWAKFSRGGEHVVNVLKRAGLVIKYSASDPIDSFRVPRPRVRPLGSEEWWPCNGKVNFPGGTSGEFRVDLQLSGSYELMFQDAAGFVTPPPRRLHARLEEDETIEIQLVRAR